jgi:predicted nucleotidyltransferase
MITMKEIEEVSKQIAQTFQPERIILFGSYAAGQPDEDSDVDLLVIMPFEGHSLRKALEIRQYIRPPFPLDLIVRTPTEVAQRLQWNDFFLREVTEKGKVLYATSHE